MMLFTSLAKEVYVFGSVGLSISSITQKVMNELLNFMEVCGVITGRTD